MKTLTSSILSMAIFVLFAFVSAISIIVGTRADAWNVVSMSSINLIIAIVGIVLSYKSARKYEDLIRKAISKLMMERAIRDFKEFCDAVKEAIPETEKEENGDELEKH